MASLVGGCVVPGSPNPDDTIDTPLAVVECLPGSAELQTPATVTVDYRTVIQDVYSCPVDSGDQSLDQGDSLSNDVAMDADVLDNEEPGDPATGVTEDGSAAGISIPVGEVSKAVYARNGTIGDTGPFSPGDEITYLLRYTMPRSDFEDFSLTDYFPLPVLQVDDHDADNTTGDAWDLSALSTAIGTITDGVVACPAAPVGTPPPSGSVVYGPGDTYHCHPGPSVVPDPPTTVPPTTAYVAPLTPTLGIDPIANSLQFTYGTYDNVPNASSVVELLVTLTVQDDPFIDGLFLTNQVRSSEENSFNVASVQDAIVQFQINEPEINIRKGVVGTDNPNADIQPVPIIPTDTTLEAALTCPRIGGVSVTSANLPGTFDSNLTGGDAGDVVTYAIVVENTGAGQNGAFDVTILDALPAGISVSDVNVGSLCVQLGDGTVLAETTGWTGDLFTAPGIVLVDPDVTQPLPLAGALAPGKSTADVENAVGDNIVIITYDVTLPVTVEPDSTLTNTAAVTNYASLPGGANFVDFFGPLEDDAIVETTIPAASKAVIDTEINSASNGQFDVVIGEVVTYTLVVTVPEGTTPAAQFVDTLDSGLAFVGCVSVTASADVTTSLACNEPTNPAVTTPGQTVTWSFGDIINANTDDTVADTITIVYQAVVLNVSGNQGAPDTNTTLDNTATFSWNVGESDETALPAVQADPVTVIEPLLTVDKSVVVGDSGTVGDAGDTVVYTIVIEHDGDSETDAWDLVISDTIPALVGSPIITVNPGDDFEIVGGVLQLKSTSNVDLALGSYADDRGDWHAHQRG